MCEHCETGEGVYFSGLKLLHASLVSPRARAVESAPRVLYIHIAVYARGCPSAPRGFFFSSFSFSFFSIRQRRKKSAVFHSRVPGDLGMIDELLIEALQR